MAEWMLSRLEEAGCLYQEEAVFHLVRIGADELLRINDGGNQVLGKPVLAEFRKLTEGTVMWARGEKCWRPRENGEGPGRSAD